MLMHIGDIILEKRQNSQNGQKELCLNGSQIPLINSYKSGVVYWLEPKKAECLLKAPNSSWIHAHLHYMCQISKWEEKLRILKKQQIEKHIGV